MGECEHTGKRELRGPYFLGASSLEDGDAYSGQREHYGYYCSECQAHLGVTVGMRPDHIDQRYKESRWSVKHQTFVLPNGTAHGPKFGAGTGA